MVGRDVQLNVRRENKNMGDVYFKVENLSLEEKGIKVLKNINFSINSGEILGIAGIEGNGQTELIEVLTGLKTYRRKIYKGDEELTGDAENLLKIKLDIFLKIVI